MRDGCVDIVLPIEESTPPEIVEALVRRAAGQMDRATLTSLACMAAYDLESVSFVGLSYVDDVWGAALRPDSIAGMLADPALALMAYVIHDADAPSVSGDALPRPDDLVFSTIDGNIDTTPPGMWMSWVRYGDALSTAAYGAFALEGSDHNSRGLSVVSRAFRDLLSRIPDDERQKAVAGALSGALRDWRHSMFLDSNRDRPVDTTLSVATVDPFVCDSQPNLQASPLVRDRSTFAERLRADFPYVAPLLLADDGPLSYDRNPNESTLPKAQVILAGGSVVNALQVESAACRLPTSDLDLWVIGTDPDVRHALLDRTVSWFFDCAAVGRCSAHARNSIITIEIAPAIAIDTLSAFDGHLMGDNGYTANNDDDSDNKRKHPTQRCADQASNLPDCLARVEIVQIIMTDAETPDQLVGRFDMAHTCAWFDGTSAGTTWDCLRAIATRTTRPMPGVRPMLSRYDKAQRKGFVPTWDRAQSPNCDTSWTYDDDHDERWPRGMGSDAARPSRGGHDKKWHTTAQRALDAFAYKPLARRAAPKEAYGMRRQFIPNASGRIYLGPLSRMRFDDDGTPRGLLTLSPLHLRIAYSTVTGGPRSLSPSHDVLSVETDVPSLQRMYQEFPNARESISDLDRNLPLHAAQLYSLLKDNILRNRSCTYTDRVLLSDQFESAPYAPLLSKCGDGSGEDSETARDPALTRVRLDIVCTRGYTNVYDGIGGAPIKIEAIRRGSCVSGTICIMGVRLDDDTGRLCAMVDPSLLWVYPPEEDIIRSLFGSDIGSF
jgi:hypothetical protein